MISKQTVIVTFAALLCLAIGLSIGSTGVKFGRCDCCSGCKAYGLYWPCECKPGPEPCPCPKPVPSPTRPHPFRPGSMPGSVGGAPQ